MTLAPGSAGVWMPVGLSGPNEDDSLYMRLLRLIDEVGLEARTSSDWVMFDGRIDIPDQGWKLHVSATVQSALTVLERCLPILLSAGTPFKVAVSLAFLAILNSGRAGRTQVGKFITIYPPDDGTAVQLAYALHQATSGLAGPRIPSDEPVTPNSIVHYRYGSFVGRLMVAEMSQLRPGLLTPAGNVVADARKAPMPPKWATKPFPNGGASAMSTALGERYRIRRLLHESEHGKVYLAVDTEASRPESVVIKEALRDSAADSSGRDAISRLTHEYRISSELRFPWLPRTLDLLKGDAAWYMVREYIAGDTLKAYIHNRVTIGTLPTLAELTGWASSLVTMIDSLHNSHVILRDLTPSNIIIDEVGGLHLLDLEIAYVLGDAEQPFPGWSAGYARPDEAPGPASDSYALGGCLFFVATGAEPLIPEYGQDVSAQQMRILHQMRPDLPQRFIRLVGALLQGDCAKRPFEASEIMQVLASLPHIVRADEVHGQMESGETFSEPSGEVAVRIGHWAVEHAQRGNGPFLWRPSRLGRQYMPIAMQTGAVGVGLYLADLYMQTGDASFLAVAEEVAEWSEKWWATSPRYEIGGLHFGLAGIPWLRIRLGTVTGEGYHLVDAERLTRLVDTMPSSHLDLAHGMAGIGMLYLSLWSATGVTEYRRRAVDIAEGIGRARVEFGRGSVWADGGGGCKFGLSEGAAGIGAFLLAVALASQQDRYMSIAEEVACALRSAAVTCCGGDGWMWPQSTRSGRIGPDRMNGAAGIGSFFACLYMIGGDPIHRLAAERAAHATAVAGKSGPAGRAHGLAGYGESLIECYQSLKTSAYLSQALQMQRILMFRSGVTEGVRLWWTEDQSQVDVDLLNGNVGVGRFHLRLAGVNTDRVISPLDLAEG